SRRARRAGTPSGPGRALSSWRARRSGRGCPGSPRAPDRPPAPPSPCPRRGRGARRSRACRSRRAPVARRRAGGPRGRRPRRPQGEESAVLREQAVEERRRLAEGAPVVPLAAQPWEHRDQRLVVARGLVHERLAPPEELEHAPALVVVVVHVLGLSPVGGPGVEARRDAPHVAPTVEGEDPPDLPVALAEPPLAKHERPGRADALGPLALVDRVRVGEEAVAAHAAPGAVDGGEEGQVEAPALPAVAGHQALAADVEGPEDGARALLSDDPPRPVER